MSDSTNIPKPKKERKSRAKKPSPEEMLEQLRGHLHELIMEGQSIQNELHIVKSMPNLPVTRDIIEQALEDCQTEIAATRENIMELSENPVPLQST